MKNFCSLLIILAVGIMLSGCGMKDYQMYRDAVNSANMSNATSSTAYWDMKKAQNEAVMSNLAQSGNETALVLYAVMAGQADEKVAQTYKAVIPEKPTTTNDIGMKVADKTVGQIMQWLGIGFIANSVVDGFTDLGNNAGDTVTMNGDGAEYNTNSHNTGSYNGNDGTVTSTEEITTTH